MSVQRWVRQLGVSSILILATVMSTVAGDKVLVGTRQRVPDKPGDNQVRNKCLTPDLAQQLHLGEQLGLKVDREKPWSLPKQALAEGQQAVIRILVLRYNFQYETVDDPNTTGRGVMNFARPLDDSVTAQAYLDSVGHLIDPPPHNIAYWDAHMRALNQYWHQVSEGHISLAWDIFPPVSDSAYRLPYQMSHYGRCDSVVIGLEDYFEDAIRLADTVQKIDPNSPDIDFSQYQAIFLVHAGSDRQNDIGFPPTCSDLFTGFIKFGDSVAVDNGALYVRTALLLPETSCQDNRATALNAVMAHEFGHELGLVDLYNTRNFLSQLGDFSLMDDNGFGTGVDFGFKVGQVFGTIPVYPDAWSRAYLGYVPVVDFKQGSDIRVVAAEVASSGIKIARVPISENSYYLIENRVQELDNRPTAVLADSQTNVILYPCDSATKAFTGEYDNLTPGSGMLIYLVDERVATLDYDGDGQNNFEGNDLQWDPNRKFITLMEADGLVNFGGYYQAGFGSPNDMFRDDRNHEFTPITNPPSIDNNGDNTHIYMTNIMRDTVRLGPKLVARLDTAMLFDLKTENLAAGFPARVGSPVYPFSPVVADLNHDGADEVIVVSGKRLSVLSSQGKDFLLDILDTCSLCPRFTDSAKASVHSGRVYQLPLYFEVVGANLSANPVVGHFGDDTLQIIAVGWEVSAGRGLVRMVAPYDQDDNGEADEFGNMLFTAGLPIAMSFGNMLYVLTDSGTVYTITDPNAPPTDTVRLPNENYHGISRVGDKLIVAAGNSAATKIYYVGATVDSFSLGRYFNWGPIVADMDRDGTPEVVMASPDGWIEYVSVDTSGSGPVFQVLKQVKTGFRFTTNPIAGDVDLDGSPDIVIGGRNAVYAFDQRAVLKTDFPIEIDDRFPHDSVSYAPIQAEIARGNLPELIFPSSLGNMYSFGLTKTYGFPLPAGESGIGSPVVFHDSTGTKLGFQGLDGWFYAWDVVSDTTRNYWPMAGHDAAGSFALPDAKLGQVQHRAEKFRDEEFYNYPNPVTNGRTTFRYTLGQPASDVSITVFDLSGQQIADLNGPSFEGDNELPWNCGEITPGVYRCRIQVKFGGETSTAFTDVAIIR